MCIRGFTFDVPDAHRAVPCILAVMQELRFHRELYPGEAVDAAIKTFDPHATLTRESSATHWIVKITAKSDRVEQRVARELCNYALGLTVRRGT